MNTSPPKADSPPSLTARFVGELRALERNDRGSDRATMAALRCGLRHSDGVAIEMMPFVAPLLPAKEAPDGKDKHFFQVAALFALHPQNGAQSFAAAFRNLAEGGSDSIEKRFQLLLACRADELFGPLFQCVSLLKSDSLPFNWKRLLDDLYWSDWDSPGREVQLKWAREFYRKAHPTTPSTASTSGESAVSTS